MKQLINTILKQMVMKEKKGYRRKLLSIKFDEWRMKTVRKWKYTWSDGTTEIKTTYREHY